MLVDSTRHRARIECVDEMIHIEMKSNNGETHTVDTARIIPEGDRHEGNFMVFTTCCTTAFILTPEQFDEMISLRVTAE